MSAATSLPPASDLATDELTDAELVHRARRGDATAADALVGRHLATVQAVCRSRLASPHDVNDAVQDTFVRALSKLDRLRDPDRVAPWLRAIAARVCVDQYRATRHVVVVPAPGAEHADLGRGPEEHAVSIEAARTLHHKLDALSQRDRRALWLRDAQGAPVGEVARDLGLTEGSARVLLTRARHRLRASYQGLAGVAIAAWIRLRDRLASWGDAHGFDVRAAAVAQAAVATAIVVAGLPSLPSTAPADEPTVVTVAPDAGRPSATAPTPVDPAPAPTVAPVQETVASETPAAVAPSAPREPSTEVKAGPATISKGSRPADAEPAAAVEAGPSEEPIGEALVYVGDVLGGGSSGSGGSADDAASDEPSGPDGSGGLLGGDLVRVRP